MHVSPNGIALISKYEGCKLAAYPDPGSGGDPWTIGYGHTKDVKKGDTCTKEQALDWLQQDADESASQIQSVVGSTPLNQNQVDALTCFVFNVGIGNFKKSTILRMIQKGDFTSAANAFEMWTKASGKVLPGLVLRRGAEKALFLKPVEIPSQPLTEPTDGSGTPDTPIEETQPESALKPDLMDRSLIFSKEIGAGVVSIGATGTQLVNSLSIGDIADAKNATTQYQSQVTADNHSIFHKSEVIQGLSVLIFLMGAFIVYKRIKDRLEGKR